MIEDEQEHNTFLFLRQVTINRLHSYLIPLAKCVGKHLSSF